MKIVLSIAVLLMVVGLACSQHSLGDQLFRTFGVFKPLPMNASAAVAEGWHRQGGCGKYGVAYTTGASGATKDSSVTVYYTQGGAFAGFQNTVWGEYPSSLIGAWWVPTGADGQYTLTVSTRDLSTVCTSASHAYGIGDRVLLNGHFDVPLNASEAARTGWVRGDCIPGMGVHWSKDLTRNGSMSWEAANLLPIMPMYDPNPGSGGKINAVLFASLDLQRVEVFGDWEGPFINSLMCLNWCKNTGCTFAGTHGWTTMHFLFENHQENTCDGAHCVISE